MLALSIISVSFVSIYLTVQVVAFISGMLSSLESMFDDMYYLNDDGFLELTPFDFVMLFLIPGFSLTVLLKEKRYIQQWARKNAQLGKYSNKFKKKSLQKIYNIAYKEFRKEAIIEKAKKNSTSLNVSSNPYRDTFSNYSGLTNPYSIPYEKALYQDAFLKAVTNDQSVTNTVKSRFNELYKDEQLEPVSDEVFQEVMSSHYQTR